MKRLCTILIVAILLAAGSAVHVAGAQTVQFAGMVRDAGPAAAIAYESDGYDLYATAPVNSGARIFIGSPFAAGTRLTSLPPYVVSITAPPGVSAASASAFPSYSAIQDPAAPSQTIRAGFETTHAPDGESTVPLVEVNLGGAPPPPVFYVGFMTNIHARRPDDYPATITLSVGQSAATVATADEGAVADGKIDLYFFRVSGALAGDALSVEASQKIRNPDGGAFNPSVSGLLFSVALPPVRPPVPSNQAAGNPSQCLQNSQIRAAFDSIVRIYSGTGAFAPIASDKRITVRPGQRLLGSVSYVTRNRFPRDAVTPLIATTSWGPPQSSWWLINRWLPTGVNSFTSTIDLEAPTVPGSYQLIFAFQGELSGDHVASGTSWNVGHEVWDPGHEVAHLDVAQIAMAQRCGFTLERRLYRSGRHRDYLPADAVTIQVAPAESSAEQIAKLHAEVLSLRREVAALKARLAALQASPGASASPATHQREAAAYAGTTVKTAPGWLVNAYALPGDLSTVPATPLAAYVSKGTNFAGGLRATTLPPDTAVAYLADAYYRAPEKGYYRFLANYSNQAGIAGSGSGTAACHAWFRIQKTTLFDAPLTIGAGRTVRESAGANLVPGYYRIQTWQACASADGAAKPLALRYDRGGILLQLEIETPSSAAPVPATAAEFVHVVRAQ